MRVRIKTLRRSIEVLAPIAYMGLIYWASSLPGLPDPEADELADRLFVWLPPNLQNILHIPAFGLLAVLWYRAISVRVQRLGVTALGAFAIAAVYGAFDEWHQLGVPGRTSSATDCLLNALGAAIGAWGYALLTAREQRQSRTPLSRHG